MVQRTPFTPSGGLGWRLFANRVEAGRQLAERLERFKDRKPCVLALPRGGVPIGFEVATRLSAPLDLVLVRKIGVPLQPELAYGAVVDGDQPELVINEKVKAVVHVPKEVLDEQVKRELAEIERRRERYLGGRKRVVVTDRIVIVVDDGIATGATVRASLKALRRANPKRLVLAVPVAPPDTIRALAQDTDEIECLAQPEDFFAIGQFYSDFHQVSDEEVIALLDRAPKERAAEEPPKGA